MKMWNDSELKPLGTTRLIVRDPKTEKKYSIEFVVVPDTLTPLIGARTAQQMGLITVHEDKFVSVAPPERERKPKIKKIGTTEQLITHHADVFSKELGTLPATVHLQVDENAEPTITPARRVPTALKEKYKEELDRLEKLGVLATVYEPTPCVSSVVIATKKSGALRTPDH